MNKLSYWLWLLCFRANLAFLLHINDGAWCSFLITRTFLGNVIKARVGSWYWWSSWYSMLLIPHFRWKLPYFIACEWKLKCPSFAHFLSRICALLVRSNALLILFRAHPVCSGALPVRSVLAHFRSGQMHFRFSPAHFWDGLVRHTSCPIQCTSGLVLYTSSPIWIRCGCG